MDFSRKKKTRSNRSHDTQGGDASGDARETKKKKKKKYIYPGSRIQQQQKKHQFTSLYIWKVHVV